MNGSDETPESADRDQRGDLSARVTALEAAVAAMARADEGRYEHLVNSLGHQFESMEKRAHVRHRALVEILTIRFDLVDRRFEQVDQRFEQVDQRFEQERLRTDEQFRSMQQYMDRRFAEERLRTDEQFRSMQQYMDRRFQEERAMTAGQFESMQRRMDDRFDRLIEALDIRFGRLERRGGSPPPA